MAGHSKVLSQEELYRYSRHILIPDFNITGQRKLKASKAIVIGAGGLGSPILMYLAAAGVGTIGIVDADTVDYSNLQRQVLYGTTDVGKSKAQLAARRIHQINPYVQVEVHETYLDSSNALELLSPYDVVIDGTDNFPTRYLTNDACIILNKPLVYGSIFQFEGQASVFNQLQSDGIRGPNYRDLFPDPPPPGMVPSCSEGGVLGVLPGIIGSIQANEAIKIMAGIGDTLSGRLFVFDALDFNSYTLNISKNDRRQNITQLIDYEEFCGLKQSSLSKPSYPQISPGDLIDLRKDLSDDLVLIDVREPYEYAIADIGGEKIPLSQLDEKKGLLPQDKTLVFYCRSGIRSGQAIASLIANWSGGALYNLQGGILAYREEVDRTLAKY